MNRPVNATMCDLIAELDRLIEVRENTISRTKRREVSADIRDLRLDINLSKK